MEVTIYYNGQAVAVEVTLEVYEFLARADHKAENLSHEQRRHWDGREFVEYIVATEGVGIYGETPEDYLCRKETLGELMAVLDTCTEAQQRRFLLYALEGLTLAEIGERGLFLGQRAALLGECGQTAFFVQFNRAGAVACTAVQTAFGCLFGCRQVEIGHDGTNKDIAAVIRMNEQSVIPDAAQTGAGGGVDLGQGGVVGQHDKVVVWIFGLERLGDCT